MISDMHHHDPPRSAADLWLRRSKQKARELRSTAHNEAFQLFRCGDLTRYLELLCRFHHYDAYNLLLIHCQYPQATCLAGAAQWRKLAGTEDFPIKPEWKDTGISLLIPFTESFGPEQYGLTWLSGIQYDISQTTIDDFSLPDAPYLPEEDHIAHLINCLKELIATKYHRSVIPVSSSGQLRSAGLVGQMDDYTILVRSDVAAAQRLFFLSQCLCQLLPTPSISLTAPQKDLAQQYTLFCLFTIWNVPLPRPLHQPPAVLSGISPDLQLPFLSLICETVRYLDEEISYIYQNQNREVAQIVPFPEDDNEPN